MSSKKKILKAAFAVFCMVSMLVTSMNPVIKAKAASNIEFVVLSARSKTLKIGDEYYLLAVTSNGKKPVFKSSDAKVASVNTYGKLQQKERGQRKSQQKSETEKRAVQFAWKRRRLR